MAVIAKSRNWAGIGLPILGIVSLCLIEVAAAMSIQVSGSDEIRTPGEMGRQ